MRVVPRRSGPHCGSRRQGVGCDGLFDLGLDAGLVDAHQGAQVDHRSVVHEGAIGQADALDRRHGVTGAGVGQHLQHGRAEAARQDALLERHDQLLVPGLLQDERSIEGPREASVDEGH